MYYNNDGFSYLSIQLFTSAKPSYEDNNILENNTFWSFLWDTVCFHKSLHHFNYKFPFLQGHKNSASPHLKWSSFWTC